MSTVLPKHLFPMTFEDAEPIRVPVKIKGKDYILFEADTDTALKYQATSSASARWEGNKVVGWDGLTQVQLILLVGCLREVLIDSRTNEPKSGPDGYPQLGRVAEGFIKALPYSITKPLFKRAQQISPALRERAEETLESIDNQIEILQRLRKELIEGEDEDIREDVKGDGLRVYETTGKDSPGSTPGSTVSVTN